MAKLWRVRTIGPTVPSYYLDKRFEDDRDYSLQLFKPNMALCQDWLSTKPAGSVIYVSFGSMADLSEEQYEELALGLKGTNHNFLWVVRESEQPKLPKGFIDEACGSGLVVGWVSQLEVLAHESTGCFVSHCGFNSALETLCLGVPMVAMPQWTDQMTNAKLVEDVWGVGIRARVDEEEVVRREEVVRCVREVMEGKKGEEIRENVSKWKKLAKEAIDEGGSSDKNIQEFVASLMK